MTHLDLAVCRLNLGIYGKDSPAALVEYVMDAAKSEEADYLLMNGDFTVHGTAAPSDPTEEQKRVAWTKIKAIVGQVMGMVWLRFPNTVVLPTIGNNDVIVHDQVPCNDTMADEYYGELFELWFPIDRPLKDRE